MWGLIINNRIFQNVETDPADQFQPDLIWVDLTGIAPAPQVGWIATFAEGAWTFAAPPANPNGSFPPPM